MELNEEITRPAKPEKPQFTQQKKQTILVDSLPIVNPSRKDITQTILGIAEVGESAASTKKSKPPEWIACLSMCPKNGL